MPVMGPTYSDLMVNNLYEKVMSLLKESGIQTHPVTHLYGFKNYQQDRDERNEQLRLAIERLVELQSWEDF